MKKDTGKISDMEMMDALMANIPDVIYFKDEKGRFIRVSHAVVKRFKVNGVKDALGKTDFDFFSKKHAEKAHREEQDVIKTGTPIIDIEEKETHENGEARWVSTTRLPLYDKNKKKVGTFGISRDITDIKEARENLRHAKIEAEKSAKKALLADQTKSLFLANMSHEIRTPMNAIIGFSEILKGQLKDPQKIKYLDIILSSGKTLLELINDILDLSKIEAGKLEMQYRPVDPKALFSDIIKIFTVKLRERGLKLLTEIDKKLPKAILIDEVRVRQILFNLVGNAIKFTSEGYIELKVEGYYYEDSSKIDLIFSVKDTGIGISTEDQKMIFDAFRQSKAQDVKKFGGTGLGLTITKKLVELMGGEIKVESSIGKGSTFKVVLKEVAVSTIESDSVPVEDLVLNIKFKNQKVLIADDIESNRLLITKMLDLYSLKTKEAANGKEAIRIAKNYKPDIILMDLRMPVMDGYEAIEIIKNDTALKNIPVVVITASAMKSDEEEISKIKCEGYIKKPIKRAELIGELKKHLGYELIKKQQYEEVQVEEVSEKVGTGKKRAKKVKKVSQEVFRELEGGLSQKLGKIKKEFIINDIEDFADEVKEFSEKHGIEDLTSWADKLLKQSSDYDLEGLADTIDKYYLILGDLEIVK